MNASETVIALGMFDGVHRGHQALLREAAAIAQAEGLTSMVYTFENHPMAFFGRPLSLLATNAERRAAMEACGIERVVAAPFDAAMARMTPDEFLTMLMEAYRPHTLVAGFNYTFGHKGVGTVEMLMERGPRYGFSVCRESAVLDADEPISSTRIRKMLLAGDAASAARLLGRPYALAGPIVRSRHIGTSLGFPTANLTPPREKLLPKPGVYASRAHTEAGVFPAVTNVGDNPTVAGTELTIETHILDFAGDLYGTELRIEFLAYLREEIRFPSREALSEQIGRDVESARRITATYSAL